MKYTSNRENLSCSYCQKKHVNGETGCPKRQTGPKKEFQQIKQEFSQIVNAMEIKDKSYWSSYRDKYLELSEAVKQLFSQTQRCYSEIISRQGKDRKGIRHAVLKDSNPVEMVKYCNKFNQKVLSQFEGIGERQIKIKNELSQTLATGQNNNFLEAIAQKTLQNHKLASTNEELSIQIQVQLDKLIMAESIIQDYRQKIQQMAKDYDQIVVAIADMLKRSEINEAELKQQNRLQKQCIQTQKIQFERYKSNFKMAPSLIEKENKLKRILENQFAEKQKQLIKQIEKATEMRLKGK